MKIGNLRIEWGIPKCADDVREALLKIASKEQPRLTPKQARSALAVNEEHPVWRAVMSILDANIDEACTQSGMPAVISDHGALASVCGGAEWLRGLKRMLTDTRIEALDEVRKDEMESDLDRETERRLRAEAAKVSDPGFYDAGKKIISAYRDKVRGKRNG